MKVHLLTFEGCPGALPADEALRRVLAEEGIDVEIEHVEVPDEQAAKRHRFLGSPSIQIDGLDIEQSRRADAPAFGCRIFSAPEGKVGVPPDEMIRAAVRRARERKMKVLFLCTGNSCRSQMAEGFARALRGDEIEAYSAGIETHGLNPSAVKVMAEAGVDISLHQSKHLDELEDVVFDYVVTVCDNARESCPLFPGDTTRVHKSFEDPPRLAKDAKTEEEALAHYRRVRDDIRSFVESMPDVLTKGGQ
jgi:arsenate reductase